MVMQNQRVPMDLIRAGDELARPQPNHALLSGQLAALFEDRATQVVLSFLKSMGTGNPRLAKTRSPVMAQMISRIIDCLAVLYVTPPDRRLIIDGMVLDDDDEDAISFASLLDESDYSAALKRADKVRSLQKHVLVTFDEDVQGGLVQLGLVGPHDVLRYSSRRMMPGLDSCEWVLFRVGGCLTPSKVGPGYEEQSLWQAWHHPPGADRWMCWQVDDQGALAGSQPYGEEGLSPFGSIPAVLLFDEYSSGNYLPIPESRVSYALEVNSQLNDLGYLVTQEAHSRYVVKTVGTGTKPPTVHGPGEVTQIFQDEDMKVLNASPKIAESIQTLDSLLQSWAASESVPIEKLISRRGDLSGEAIIASERDLENRRREKAPSVYRHERKMFEKFRMVHNAFARQWAKRPIPASAELHMTLGRQLRAKSQNEKQMMLFKEMAAGLSSVITYYEEMHGMTRYQAIETYRATQLDRQRFPILNAQPFGALLSDGGPLPALGEGASTRAKGLFHPDQASSVEGASVTEAVKAATEEIIQ